jgi:hypothetical protein
MGLYLIGVLLKPAIRNKAIIMPRVPRFAEIDSHKHPALVSDPQRDGGADPKSAVSVEVPGRVAFGNRMRPESRRGLSVSAQPGREVNGPVSETRSFLASHAARVFEQPQDYSS